MLYQIVKPLLFRLEADRAHELITALLRATAGTPITGILQAIYAYDDPMLTTHCAGLSFKNPIGLAAGFDKRAALIEPIAALGFGHIEVGTVTPRPQPGNPRPRMFRLPEDAALINRLGFNSPGMVTVARNLRSSLPLVMNTRSTARGDFRPTAVGQQPIVSIGVNIGKNRDTPLECACADYLATFVALAPLADYVTINISSPNTPGLRRLHERAALEALLGELSALNAKLTAPRPLFLKISPDESPEQIEQVVQAAQATAMSGFIATNTTLSRTGLHSLLANEPGGLSGRPLAELARRTIAHLRSLTAGKMPIIGVGGVQSAQDAYNHICAGAGLIQLYTGLVYKGPGLVYRIKRELVELLRRDGHQSVADAVGS